MKHLVARFPVAELGEFRSTTIAADGTRRQPAKRDLCSTNGPLHITDVADEASNTLHPLLAIVGPATMWSLLHPSGIEARYIHRAGLELRAVRGAR
jgi:hypothetical protein